MMNIRTNTYSIRTRVDMRLRLVMMLRLSFSNREPVVCVRAHMDDRFELRKVMHVAKVHYLIPRPT
jgi:hypothetical protein